MRGRHVGRPVALAIAAAAAAAELAGRFDRRRDLLEQARQAPQRTGHRPLVTATGHTYTFVINSKHPFFPLKKKKEACSRALSCCRKNMRYLEAYSLRSVLWEGQTFRARRHDTSHAKFERLQARMAACLTPRKSRARISAFRGHWATGRSRK